MTQISKTFAEINSINVNKYTEQKGKFTYLSWVFAWAEIKKLDPQATFRVHKNEKSMPFFYDIELPEVGAFVEVSITFNGLELTEIFPITDNFNKAIPVSKLNAFIINTATKRCLAKTAALHGLGLYIYAGEDLPETVVETTIKEKLEVLTEKEFLDNKSFDDDSKLMSMGINLYDSDNAPDEIPLSEESGDWAYAPVLKEDTGSAFDAANADILKAVKVFNTSGYPNPFVWNKTIKNYVLLSKFDITFDFKVERITKKEYLELIGTV
jgi:hypothetical protein